MNPTAELADIVLPVASCFEREALRFGFEISAEAQSLVQLRQPVAPPPGAARSDTDIIFDLAVRLGLGEHFWNGDVEAAYRHQLAPSGLSLEALRAEPRGIRVPLTTRYAKHAEPDAGGNARGFATPSRKVEFWSETLQSKGYAPASRLHQLVKNHRSCTSLCIVVLRGGHRHRWSQPPTPCIPPQSGARVGLAPTGKRRLVTAHTSSGHCGPG